MDGDVDSNDDHLSLYQDSNPVQEQWPDVIRDLFTSIRWYKVHICIKLNSMPIFFRNSKFHKCWKFKRSRWNSSKYTMFLVKTAEIDWVTQAAMGLKINLTDWLCKDYKLTLVSHGQHSIPLSELRGLSCWTCNVLRSIFCTLYLILCSIYCTWASLHCIYVLNI